MDREGRREALEAAVWRLSGARGAEAVDAVLEAVDGYVEAVAQERAEQYADDAELAPDVWEGDPYGDALLAAVEEAATEDEHRRRVALMAAELTARLEREQAEAGPDVMLTGTAERSEKPCATCGVSKPLTDFKPDASMRGGYRSDCKVCINVKGRALRASRRSAR